GGQNGGEEHAAPLGTQAGYPPGYAIRAAAGSRPVVVDRTPAGRICVALSVGPGKGARMPAWVRWALAAAVVVLIVGVPSAAFRMQYAHAKRFREVAPGRFYRSGQMTAAGFREMIRRY